MDRKNSRGKTEKQSKIREERPKSAREDRTGSQVFRARSRAAKMKKLRSREVFPPVEVVILPRGSGENLMIISGGLIKPHAGVVGFAVQATARMVNGSAIDFVAARLNDHWLLKAAGGESAVKGFCRDSHLLNLLKEKNPSRIGCEG